ncbi:conserved hypothetical protein [Paecilomyces variotii No. 5]|uniref:Uncharacterized protein n=1 Tax=Byssochlamys spectabilis (strain No. 5 / NBRC 109023) TaxID=1356009 RepID=V5HY73_BYSSN|nr:conserved hypothetical protein [Paecilomyces variotii No. 5]
MTTSQSEADVIFNRANIALARSQRLVASWLPPKSDAELAEQTKSEEELQIEEDEIFTAVPEKLGLGAPLPKATEDGSWNRTELSSNDKLRQQLMGKGYAKAMAAKQRQLQLQQNMNKRPDQGKAGTKSSARTEEADDDDDEEEGRSSLGNKKRKVAATGAEDGANEETVESKEASASASASAPVPGTESGRGKKKKKTGSYLDELLSQRSKKKKK